MTTPYSPGDNVPPPQSAIPQVTITVEDITFPDTDAKVKETNTPGDIFTDYLVISEYYKDNGIFMMGVTSPNGDLSGDDAAFVQIRKSTIIWVCSWTASRLVTQPEAPSSTPLDSNWVLLDGGNHLNPAMLTVGPDGVTPLYRISGTYVYGRRKATADLVNYINFPLPPWLEDTFDRSMPTSKMIQGISDAQGLVLVGFQ